MNELVIWNYLKGKGLTDYAVAGIMGNLYAESGLIPNNLQNNYEAMLGMNDAQYTSAVDDNTYGNFVYDMAGYGLAQWTFWSRKQGLLNLAKQNNKSIGDLNIQLDFLWSELQEFGLVRKLNECNNIKDASNIILFEYEKPFDSGTAVQNARAKYSEDFYNKYHNQQIVSEPQETCVVIAYGKFNTQSEAQVALAYLKTLHMDGKIL